MKVIARLRALTAQLASRPTYDDIRQCTPTPTPFSTASTLKRTEAKVAEGYIAYTYIHDSMNTCDVPRSTNTTTTVTVMNKTKALRQGLMASPFACLFEVPYLHEATVRYIIITLWYSDDPS